MVLCGTKNGYSMASLWSTFIFKSVLGYLHTSIQDLSLKEFMVSGAYSEDKTLFSYDYVQNIAQPLILCLNRINVKLKE